VDRPGALGEHVVGRNTAIHHQMRSALPYWASILRRAFRRVVQSAMFPGQHLIGERQTLGRHDQCNQRLDAVAALVAAIAKAAFIILIIRWRRLKISLREPTPRSVIIQRVTFICSTVLESRYRASVI
jgi:hypothetical protein